MIRYLSDSLFEFLQDNPSVAAGSCTFAVAFALVAGNAFYAQSGAHPEPIWSTRDLISTDSIDKTPSNEPVVRRVTTAVIKPKAVPVPSSRETAKAIDAERELVERIQKGLVLTGDYEGLVDGKMGPVTRSAIMAFEKRNGLFASGQPSPELLGAIMKRNPSAKLADNNSRSDALSSLITENRTDSDRAREEFDRATVEAIQKALAKAGFGELTIDGIYGSQTREAISRFQRQHDMEVTGVPDPATLKKLGNG